MNSGSRLTIHNLFVGLRPEAPKTAKELCVGKIGFTFGLPENRPYFPCFPRDFNGGRWIRTSSTGASGEADAFLPVKDRPR
jgi:hypothetical protein